MRPANTAIHLSRLRKVLFLADHTLRPGDGQRYAEEGIESTH
jgi:hypothetical protein